MLQGIGKIFIDYIRNSRGANPWGNYYRTRQVIPTEAKNVLQKSSIASKE